MSSGAKPHTSTRKNDRQWIETRGGRAVTVTEHPVRPERVEFLNEPDDSTTGPLTLKFHLAPGHTVDEHSHPEQVETFTVNSGRLRAIIDGEERIVDPGGHERIAKGVPHGYTVVSDDPVVLSVTISPALRFKEFVIAEHALSADDYPESGLNIPYFSLVTKRYGPAIAPPKKTPLTRAIGAILPTVARLRGLAVPDDPLPVRDGGDASDLSPPGVTDVPPAAVASDRRTRD
ncbi:cupin domain-containing protein [Haloferacaceae archaeon DSL9]